MYTRSILLLMGIALFQIGANVQHAFAVKSSTVTFKIKNAGITVDGSFSGLNATIIFDQNNLSSSSIEASIDANTIQTGIAMRDNHLRKEEYFGVNKYPRITIKSKKIEKDGPGYKGYFKLMLKGVTKDVIIPFSFDGQSISGSFKLNRTEYGVGGSSWVTSSDVDIKIAALLEKYP